MQESCLQFEKKIKQLTSLDQNPFKQQWIISGPTERVAVRNQNFQNPLQKAEDWSKDKIEISYKKET